jgi:predicted secreted protein
VIVPPNLVKEFLKDVSDHYHNQGVCDLVSGNISPDGVCDHYILRTSDHQYRDKEFYQREYDKKKIVKSIKAF